VNPLIVRKSGSSQVWITDLIFKRLVNDESEQAILAVCGAQRDANGEPLILAATVIDDLSTVPRGG
jgi:hypothetical protein